ncbi:hypothetical protein [Kitasatospora sp. NPDC057500]|uniref:hypothetical protein n=1 Tax=Kitasatospora sp. NPDC057500 TaxID=3346151 RepID=UPI0036BD78A6
MTVYKQTARTLTLVAALLSAAGCASTAADTNPAPTSAAPAPIPASTLAALSAVAQNYQDAVNRGDWQTSCSLSSALLRGGTVADCVTTSTTRTPAPTPTSAPAVPSGPTPVIPTLADMTPAGPATAATGDIIQVPAGPGAHPVGYGVYVTFPLSKPGRTDRWALRVVEEGGTWVIDQREDYITRAAQMRRVLLGQ